LESFSANKYFLAFPIERNSRIIPYVLFKKKHKKTKQNASMCMKKKRALQAEKLERRSHIIQNCKASIIFFFTLFSCVFFSVLIKIFSFRELLLLLFIPKTKMFAWTKWKNKKNKTSKRLRKTEEYIFFEGRQWIISFFLYDRDLPQPKMMKDITKNFFFYHT
jgi:hypothetical protein